jgi:uncharacterized membrane protein
MNPIRLLPWILWLALAVFTAATYDLLPADIPQQIDAAGAVTRTTARTPLAWSLLPAVALLTLVLTQGIAALLPSHPHLFNFPAKDKLLAMPAEARAPVIAHMRRFMDISSLLVMLVMFGAQWMLWQSAQGHTSATGNTVLMVVSIAIAPVLLLLIARLNSATEQAHAAWVAAKR